MKVDIDKMSIESLKEILKRKEEELTKGVKKQIVSRYDSTRVLFEYFDELKNINLKGSNLEDADLRNIDLEGANLKDIKSAYAKINFSPNEYKQAKQFIEGLKK